MWPVLQSLNSHRSTADGPQSTQTGQARPDNHVGLITRDISHVPSGLHFHLFILSFQGISGV